MKLELKHITPYLPYGLKVYYAGLCDDDVEGVFTVMSSHYNDNGISILSDEFDEIDLSESIFIYLDFPVKLSLRPINSITKEEAYDLISIAVFNQIVDIDDIKNLVLDIENSDVIIRCVYKGSIYNETKFSIYINYDEILFTSSKKGEEGALMTNMSMYQYLFSKHFDVFGLINKGLAINKDKIK